MTLAVRHDGQQEVAYRGFKCRRDADQKVQYLASELVVLSENCIAARKVSLLLCCMRSVINQDVLLKKSTE